MRQVRVKRRQHEQQDTPAAVSDEGPLGQDSIDALLSGLSGAPAPCSFPLCPCAAEAEPPAQAQPDVVDEGPVDQGGIDALLAEMGMSAGAAEPAPPPPVTSSSEQPQSAKPRRKLKTLMP